MSFLKLLASKPGWGITSLTWHSCKSGDFEDGGQCHDQSSYSDYDADIEQANAYHHQDNQNYDDENGNDDNTGDDDNKDEDDRVPTLISLSKRPFLLTSYSPSETKRFPLLTDWCHES